MAAAIEPSIYLSTDQVRARFGGVSRMWVHRAIRRHGFPRPVKFGNRSVRGRAFYSRVAVERWEANQTPQQTHQLEKELGL